MNIKQTLLGCTLASFMFAACSSDDSGTGGSSGSCDVSALPASSLSFESTGDGCVAESSMDAVAFMSMVADYTNAGWLPFAANAQPNGDGEYSFSKQDGTVSHSVTLTTTGGNVVVVYVKTGGDSTDPGTNPSTPNASTCDLATAKLPPSELAWKPTFAGGCEVSQTISLANLQKFDTLLIKAGYEKEVISNENFRYTILVEDPVASTVEKDTLFFAYTMETFVGTFSGAVTPMSEMRKLEIELLDVAQANLPPELFAQGRFVISSYSEEGYFYISGNSEVYMGKFVQSINQYGWILLEGYYNWGPHEYKGSKTYNGHSYSMTLTYEESSSGLDSYRIEIEKVN